jgi:hypothetical protein
MCRAAMGAPRDVKVEACAYPTTTGGFGGTTTWGPLPDCQ